MEKPVVHNPQQPLTHCNQLRMETAKPWTDYVDNLICCLLNFTVAQQLSLLGLCLYVGQLHT